MKVDPQFEHLVVVDSRDSLSGDEVSKLFDSETDASELADPVHEFFKKAERDRFSTSAGVSDFSWDEQLGTVVEKQYNYNVGGELLAKGEIASRMSKVLAEIKPFCLADEVQQIEKSIRCLDLALFGELVEPVVRRMRHAIT